MTTRKHFTELKRVFQRATALLLAVAMCVGFFSAVTVSANAANTGNTMSDPVIITFGQTYTKSWNKDTDHLNHYNKFTLSEQGIVTITATKPYDSDAEYGRLKFTVYDEEGEPIWGNDSFYGVDSARDSYKISVGLSAGTYYLTIKPGFSVYSGTISTQYSLSFSANAYCELEPNSDGTSSTPVVLNQKYTGYFGSDGNDYEESDYFRFSVAAGHTYRIYGYNVNKLSPTSTMVKLLMPGGDDHSVHYYWEEYIDNEGLNYTDVTIETSGTAYLRFYNFNGAQFEYGFRVVDLTCEKEGHEYGPWTQVDDNIHKRACTGCGLEETNTHTWNQGSVTKQPDCANEGVKTYTCSICSGTKTEAIANNDAHRYDTGVVTKEPTCAEEGVKTYTCYTCGNTKTETIPKTNVHNYDRIVTSAPTCSAPGVMTCTCILCGHSYTEAIPANPHNFVGGSCANCGAPEVALGDVNNDGRINTADAKLIMQFELGLADENKLHISAADVNSDGRINTADAKLIMQFELGLIPEVGHAWIAATCTTPKTCKNCGVTEGPALGHSWNNATCTTPKTCSSCGATEGTVSGHSWVDATCTTPKTCATCGAVEGTALGHNWSDATCIAPQTCTTCGVTEGTVLDHSWIDATCVAPKTCRMCGATEGGLTDHNYVDGTCINCGLEDPNYVKYYTIGETWIVDGQWEITVNSVTVHSLCNSYANGSHGYTNEQVITIDYTYKNIGYDRIDGLFVSSASFDVYDETGTSASTYACTHRKYAKSIMYGTSCTATETYVLSNYSSSILLSISMYHAENGSMCYPMETAVFKLVIGESGGNTGHTHSWVDATCTTPKTCSTCGATEGYALGHSFSGGICRRCGETQSSPVDTLKQYIRQNGEYMDGGKYYIYHYDNKQLTGIVYDPSDSSLMFLMQFEGLTETSVTGMFYQYGAATQKVVYSTEVTDLSANGYIITGTFSAATSYVYGFECSNSYYYDELHDLTGSSLVLMFTALEECLRKTGTGVTLYDLGFTSW